jgi:hypothetical protein
MEYAIVVIVAVAVIGCIVIGAWAYVAGSNRNGDRLWEELITLRGQYQHLLDIALYRQGLPNSITDKRREERRLEEGNEKNAPQDIAPWDIFAARQKAIADQLKGQDVGFGGDSG